MTFNFRLMTAKLGQHASGRFGVEKGDLFAAGADHPALTLLADSDPDALTPRQAHDLLYALRDMLE